VLDAVLALLLAAALVRGWRQSGLPQMMGTQLW
jgi:hypothetical protein